MGHFYIPRDDCGSNRTGSDLPLSELTNLSLLDLYNSSLANHDAPFNIGRLLNMILAVMGILANMASLTAMCHISGPLSANQRLIISLLLSDLFVSSTILTTVINNALFPFFLGPGKDYGQKLCLYTVLKALVMTSHTISLFNLVLLSLDHFLAINKPLRYMQLMTGKRVSCGIGIVWILAAFCGFSDFLLPGQFYLYCEDMELVNFCEVGYCTKYETEYLLFPLVHVCFIIMAVFYSQVFHTIYQYQTMTGRHQRHMRRNIKGLVTTLLILGSFLVCWLPHCIFEAYILVKSQIDHMGVMAQYKLVMRVDYYLYSLWLANSVCDPIIYAVRMREIKNGYYRMVKCNRRDSSVVSSPRLCSASYYRRSVTNTSAVENMELKSQSHFATNNSV